MLRTCPAWRDTRNTYLVPVMVLAKQLKLATRAVARDEGLKNVDAWLGTLA